VQATERVLRTLVDAALEGRRAWANVGDLAWEAGVGEKLAYKALAKPASIGAITKHAGGGFSVTDPERALMLLSVRRTHTSARLTTLEAAQALVAGLDAYAWGGTRAASHHLPNGSAIADHAPAIVYVPEGTSLTELPPGTEAAVHPADARSLDVWADGYTSKAQTYADLFAQPGWQSSEFRRALWREWFTADDWAQAEVAHA